jgi:hypothetical protein
MSKYDKLWKYIAKKNNQSIELSFDQIKEINGIEIDHSFLNFKRELNLYGYKVGKISLKNKKIEFMKIQN